MSWNSQFYILLRNFFYYNDLAGRISLWFTKKNQGAYSQLDPYLIDQPDYLIKAWDETFVYLSNLVHAAQNNHCPLVIISVPLKLEVDRDILTQILTANQILPDQVNMNHPLDQILSFCRRNGLDLLDPRPTLQARHKETPCYFVYDGHWNAEGIKVAAESITIQWREAMLPPWNNTTTKQGKNRRP